MKDCWKLPEFTQYDVDNKRDGRTVRRKNTAAITFVEDESRFTNKSH